MGFNRDVIRRRRDQLHELGVRVRWAGPPPAAVAQRDPRAASRRAADRRNTRLTLQFCVNYGGRAEIADAAAAIAAGRRRGAGQPGRMNEKTFARYLYEPDMPDVDLFVRSSGEQRTSNFLLWQSAYAEMVFLPRSGPTSTGAHLWEACETYASRDRRYGGAVPNSVGPGGRPSGTPRDAPIVAPADNTAAHGA